MVQAEVGARLAAVPGSRSYGAVSVRVAYFATARVVGRVPPEVFHPRPKVDSALVAIERRDRPAVDPGLRPTRRSTSSSAPDLVAGGRCSGVLLARW